MLAPADCIDLLDHSLWARRALQHAGAEAVPAEFAEAKILVLAGRALKRGSSLGRNTLNWIGSTTTARTVAPNHPAYPILPLL